MDTPTADDHEFAQIVNESDETVAQVRKIVAQYNRGLLTELDLLLALGEINPNDLPKF